MWRTESAADGAFSLPAIPAVTGSYLHVLREPYAPEVLAAPGFSDEKMYVVLERSRPEGPTLSGRVVDQKGAPVGGARVGRLPEAAVHHTLIRHGPMTTTDSDGRFSFRDVPRQRIILSIYGDPILPCITPLAELGDPENLEISVQGRYHLQVILDDPGNRGRGRSDR